MTFIPALTGTGFAGWAALKRTQALQTKAMVNSAEIRRDEDYFRAKIGSVKTADDLMKDRRLLKVALTAYGLEADINSTAFIKKILSDGTLKTDALANKLSDKQYLKFSAAFGFGDFAKPRTQLSDFADKTLALYRARSFESAVGQSNGDYRLALNAEREIAALADKTMGEDTMWYTVLGNTPMRTVMQTALGLPSSIASMDLDRQLEVFKDRAEAVFGSASVKQFSDPAAMDKLLKTYLLRSEVANYDAQTAGSSAVLTLLQQTESLARNRIF
jgi:Protein of unknown function (DUF1217)